MTVSYKILETTKVRFDAMCSGQSKAKVLASIVAWYLKGLQDGIKPQYQELVGRKASFSIRIPPDVVADIITITAHVSRHWLEIGIKGWKITHDYMVQRMIDTYITAMGWNEETLEAALMIRSK